MYLGEKTKISITERVSKRGVKHKCKRTKTFHIFKCDVCTNEFTRSKGKIEKKRLSTFYKHVCSECDPKRFAQQQGVKQRQVLGMNASSDIPISKL